MSARLRQFVSRLLLIALLFNALTPLIAAAQDRAGKGSILAFCTASGLKQIAVNLDGKTLPKPAQQNACPFCMLSATASALPTAPLSLAYLQLRPEVQAEYLAPTQKRDAHQLVAAPRGPPALS